MLLFLIQNAFPITSNYFDHIHTSQGKPLTLHESTAKTIVNNLRNNLLLHKKGVRIFFTDIDRIYNLMAEELLTNKKDEQLIVSDIETGRA